MTLVRALERADWAAVEDIYREGIEGGNATFETETPTWDAFDQAKARFGRLVAVDDAHAVVGWVAASPVSARAAYRGVVEHSVYVAARAQGRGIGCRSRAGVHRLGRDERGLDDPVQRVPENTASLRLHEGLGFREVGRRERIARSLVGPWAGQWRDTVLIERRSAMNGRG